MPSSSPPSRSSLSSPRISLPRYPSSYTPLTTPSRGIFLSQPSKSKLKYEEANVKLVSTLPANSPADVRSAGSKLRARVLPSPSSDGEEIEDADDVTASLPEHHSALPDNSIPAQPLRVNTKRRRKVVIKEACTKRPRLASPTEIETSPIETEIGRRASSSLPDIIDSFLEVSQTGYEDDHGAESHSLADSIDVPLNIDYSQDTDERFDDLGAVASICDAHKTPNTTPSKQVPYRQSKTRNDFTRVTPEVAPLSPPERQNTSLDHIQAGLQADEAKATQGHTSVPPTAPATANPDSSPNHVCKMTVCSISKADDPRSEETQTIMSQLVRGQWLDHRAVFGILSRLLPSDCAQLLDVGDLPVDPWSWVLERPWRVKQNKVLAPIRVNANDDGHWILLHLNLQDETITAYDSYTYLSTTEDMERVQTFAMRIAAHIKQPGSTEGSEKQWRFEKSSLVMQEQDGHSSGLRVIVNALSVAALGYPQGGNVDFEIWRILFRHLWCECEGVDDDFDEDFDELLSDSPSPCVTLPAKPNGGNDVVAMALHASRVLEESQSHAESVLTHITAVRDGLKSVNKLISLLATFPEMSSAIDILCGDLDLFTRLIQRISDHFAGRQMDQDIKELSEDFTHLAEQRGKELKKAQCKVEDASKLRKMALRATLLVGRRLERAMAQFERVREIVRKPGR